MRANILYFLMVLFIISASSCNSKNKGEAETSLLNDDKVLVFSKTAGFRHKSIETGKEALIKLGQANNFKVDTTEDASVFILENLYNYKAIVFLNTTGDVFNEEQEDAFKKYIQGGGGFVGIHAATDTEYDWPWYNQLVGAYFKNHPEQQEAEIEILNHSHPSTSFFPHAVENNRWKRFDEWYNFKSMNEEVIVLATLDETTYKGGENGDFHPIAWYHEFDGGRAFYTALGHTKESYSEELFLNHILGGIKWAMGKE